MTAASLAEKRAQEKEVRRLVAERAELMGTGAYSSRDADRVIAIIDEKIADLTSAVAGGSRDEGRGGRFFIRIKKAILFRRPAPNVRNGTRDANARRVLRMPTKTSPPARLGNIDLFLELAQPRLPFR